MTFSVARYAMIAGSLQLKNRWGGYNHWTGLLDWTTGLDYWTRLLDWTTGLDYWTGLLDWTTGLTQTAKYNSFSAEQKLNVLIPSVTSLTLLPTGSFLLFPEVKGHVHI